MECASFFLEMKILFCCSFHTNLRRSCLENALSDKICFDRQQGYYSTYEQTVSTKTPLRLTRTVRKGPSPSPHKWRAQQNLAINLNHVRA